MRARPPPDPVVVERLALLSRLAGGLCRDAKVTRLEVSEEGTWAWNSATGVVSVGADALLGATLTVCAGILAHEVGHALLSRHNTAGIPLAYPEAARCLNAIEDGRVERWMALRYPGVAPWLEEAMTRSLERRAGHPAPALGMDQFVLAACIEGAGRAVPWSDALLPRVRQALADTADARRRYRDAYLPPTDLDRWTLTEDDVELLERIAEHFGAPPETSGRETVAQVWAARALTVARAEILPAHHALYVQDVEELASILAADDALAGLVRAHIGGDARLVLPPVARVLREARAGLRRTAAWERRHIGYALRWLRRRGGAKNTGVLPSPAEEVEGRATSVARAPSERAGASPAASVATNPVSDRALAERLRDALDAALHRDRAALGRSHGHTGLRANLRRVMANEGPYAGDPARQLPPWRRAERTDHHAAFGLLIDCSGSMRGDKIAAAIRAARVFAEALHALRVPYFVSGFQDVLIPLAAAGASLAEVHAGIAAADEEVRDARRGGNNAARHNDDGPCVWEAACALAEIPARQRVLVVLSDGCPAGIRSNADDLHASIERIRRAGTPDLIGVGIGADAGHVRDFYPRHAVVARVEELPAALVALLTAPARLRGTPAA